MNYGTLSLKIETLLKKKVLVKTATPYPHKLIYIDYVYNTKRLGHIIVPVKSFYSKFSVPCKYNKSTIKQYSYDLMVQNYLEHI